MEKPKPKTLIQQAREVEALLGGDCSIVCQPEFAAVEPKNGEAVALYGTAKGGWRIKNEKIIARLKAKLAQPVTVAP